MSVIALCRPRLQVKFGGASRDRTDGLVVANDALSQLSYSPVSGWIFRQLPATVLFYQRSFVRTILRTDGA
jgi:hypothetical protein